MTDYIIRLHQALLLAKLNGMWGWAKVLEQELEHELARSRALGRRL